MHSTPRRPPGVTALSIFFAAGTIPSSASALALAWPGAWAERMWQLKPEAPAEFAQLGLFAIPLMLAVAVACAGAAVGLWTGRAWGRYLALTLLIINLVGDTLNGAVRSDWRTLVGLPIGGAMLVYLLSRPVRVWFSRPRP